MKYEDLKPNAEPPLPPEEREKIVRDVLNSQNCCRQSIAKEIEAGDLYNWDGRPKTYWHCLATQRPPTPPGQRGRWKAMGGRPSGWEWQDWGRAPATADEIERARKAMGDKWTVSQSKILERGWTKDDIEERLGDADKVVTSRVGRTVRVWYERRVRDAEESDPEFRETIRQRVAARRAAS